MVGAIDGHIYFYFENLSAYRCTETIESVTDKHTLNLNI